MNPAGPRLGLRVNLFQFSLLVAVNALVGAMVGQEQTVLPLLAESVFGLTGYTFLLTYVLALGITKALTNYLAGTLSDRFGRKPVLVAGWLTAVPVALAADLWGLRAAVWSAAAITAASAVAVAVRMYETHPRTASGE